MPISFGKYFQGDTRVKPRMYGPVSAVQRDIWMNAERVGIDPASIALYLPMWGPGDQQDYGRKAITGTNYGVAYNKGALEFTGYSSNDKIILPDDDDYRMVSPQGTIICKVSVNAVDTYSYQGMWFVRDGSTQESGFLVLNEGSGHSKKIQFAASVGSVLTPENYAVVNEYRTYAVTWDGTTVKIYSISENGTVLLHTETSNIAPQTSSILPVIGNRTTGGRCLDGKMAWFAGLSVALTPSQIALLSDHPYLLLARNPARTWFIPSGAGLPTPTNLSGTATANKITWTWQAGE